MLNEKTKTAILKQDQITDLEFENEKIKGKIETIKVSEDDNKLTGETKGTKLDGSVFEIYNDKDKLIDTITIKEGIGKGIIQSQPNDEIKYGFNSLKNTSNLKVKMS